MWTVVQYGAGVPPGQAPAPWGWMTFWAMPAITSAVIAIDYVMRRVSALTVCLLVPVPTGR